MILLQACWDRIFQQLLHDLALRVKFLGFRYEEYWRERTDLSRSHWAGIEYLGVL
jgi:hypothetical protein